MSERRVVITGMGLVSAAGCDVEGAWQRIVDGCSAVGPIRRFNASKFPSRIAAQVDDERITTPPELEMEPASDRIAHYAVAAAASAVDDARLSGATAALSRAGVVVAAGMGRYHHREIFTACARAAAGGRDRFDWDALCAALLENIRPRASARRTPGSIASLIAETHHLGGPAMAVMTACAGGTQAIGDAMRWIRSGRADIVLAGGADSELYPMGLASFCLLGALSTRNDDPAAASRPFEAARDGFVLGEGAGMLLLEEREHARRRGARVYAEACGFGSACDAYRATDPHPQGVGAVLAMNRALADARVEPADVDYINAHGTSTPANDRAETIAIKRVFGDCARQIPVSSTKSMIGHATVAAGAIEAVVSALTLRDQVVHPTINYEDADPECDLDYVPNHAQERCVRVVLSNSFAFGGQTACLVLRQHH